MKKATLLLALALLAGCAPAPTRQAGMSQVVETRRGRRSVWGVDLRLENLSFAPSISADEIAIVDGKHGRDLRPIMEWSVAEGGRCLRIRFKPGCGDFGTGNGVTVHIERSAIPGYTGPDNRFEWSMTTDVQ